MWGQRVDETNQTKGKPISRKKGRKKKKIFTFQKKKKKKKSGVPQKNFLKKKSFPSPKSRGRDFLVVLPPTSVWHFRVAASDWSDFYKVLNMY